MYWCNWCNCQIRLFREFEWKVTGEIVLEMNNDQCHTQLQSRGVWVCVNRRCYLFELVGTTCLWICLGHDAVNLDTWEFVWRVMSTFNWCRWRLQVLWLRHMACTGLLSKVNKLICLFTKNARAKIFHQQKLTPNWH